MISSSYRPFSQGFSLAEMLVSIAVGILIIAALSLFFARGITINRQDYEQILITEDARLQMARLSDVIRNSTVNSSGAWLKTAGDNSLTIYGEGTTAGAVDEITYAVSGTTLTQTITPSSGPAKVTTLSQNIRNIAQGKKMFTYYSSGNTVIDAASATTLNVKKIGITMLVDVNVNQKPDAAEVTTVILPRSVIGTLSSPSRYWAVGIRYPSSPTTNSGAEVNTTNPSTGAVGREVWPILIINAGRLATYNGYPVNINYQSSSNGSFIPGWYAWIGPIEVGESGTQPYYVTDQVPVSSLCLGQDLATLLSTCPMRTVTAGGFTTQYQPIITYTGLGGQDYLRAISFDYTGL